MFCYLAKTGIRAEWQGEMIETLDFLDESNPLVLKTSQMVQVLCVNSLVNYFFSEEGIIRRARNFSIWS